MERSETKRLVIIQDQAHHAHVAKKPNEFGEYVTRYYTMGKYLTEADDFQCTFEDAERTALANLKFMNNPIHVETTIRIHSVQSDNFKG